MNKDGPNVQGEGDDEPARKYQQDTGRFVAAGKVKPAADQARTMIRWSRPTWSGPNGRGPPVSRPRI